MTASKSCWLADVLSVGGAFGNGPEAQGVLGGRSRAQSKPRTSWWRPGERPTLIAWTLPERASGWIREATFEVNEELQTSAADVWAMGDCAGSPQFTHVAYDDFRVVLDKLAGGSRTTRDRLIPYCLFTDPELAHVGLSESEAKAKNLHYRVATLPMSSVMRMRTLSETRGFMKALIGAGRSHPGFHRVRRRSERVNGRRSDGDARRHAIHAHSRCNLYPPDGIRRTCLPVHKRNMEFPMILARCGATKK